MRMRRLALFALICFFSGQMSVMGQEDAPADIDERKIIELEEIVVTATRTLTPLGNVPASVTVIGREKIEGSTTRTADDVLRSVPGVDNWGSNVCDQGFRTVTLRGVGTQGRTLILVDGIPVNGSWDGWVAWSQVPKENIERIEVVRGPASSLYGTNAMGGVINIITKKPADKPVEIELKETYGSLNTWSSLLGVSGRTKTLGYALSYQHSASDGYKPYPSPHQWYHTKNEYKLDNFDGRFFWFIDEESHLKLGVSHFYEERNRGRRYSNINPREIDRMNLTYHRDTAEGIDWLASVYWHNENRKIEFDSPPMYNVLNLVEEFHEPFYGAVIQPSIPLSDQNTLTMGFEFKHSDVEKKDEYKTSLRRAEHEGKQEYVALYLQDEMLCFDDKLVVTLGARQDWWKNYDGASWDTDPPAPNPPFNYDYDSEEWNSFNPKLGLLYRVTGRTTLRASIGTGFQAPSPARMYSNLTRGPRLILGNPELDPEHTLSYEVGVDHHLTDSLHGSLTLYQGDGKDFIRSRLVTPPLTYQFDNISEVRMRGVEIDLDYKITREWSCSCNYTYNESTIEDDIDPAIEGNDLENTPRIKFNFELTYQNPKFLTVSVLARYVDEMYDDLENTIKLDDYWRTDLKLSRKIGDDTEVSLACENLFDRKYEIPSFDIYEAPGQMWTLSLGTKF